MGRLKLEEILDDLNVTIADLDTFILTAEIPSDHSNTRTDMKANVNRAAGQLRAARISLARLIKEIADGNRR